MKRKGKPNVPIGARGGQNNARMAEEAMRAERDAAPGMPVFEIFCRTRRVPMWYPCGALGGDARSKVHCCDVCSTPACRNAAAISVLRYTRFSAQHCNASGAPCRQPSLNSCSDMLMLMHRTCTSWRSH
jgi:Family of unknown function (DUF6523)